MYAWLTPRIPLNKDHLESTDDPSMPFSMNITDKKAYHFSWMLTEDETVMLTIEKQFLKLFSHAPLSLLVTVERLEKSSLMKLLEADQGATVPSTIKEL